MMVRQHSIGGCGGAVCVCALYTHARTHARNVLRMCCYRTLTVHNVQLCAHLRTYTTDCATVCEILKYAKHRAEPPSTCVSGYLRRATSNKGLEY